MSDPALTRGDAPLSALSGVGPRRQAQLQKLGLFSVRDLLAHFPRDYEDWSRITPIARLEDGATACVRGTVARPLDLFRKPGGKTLSRTAVFDDTGKLSLTFFNNKYLRLETGRDYLFFGKTVFYGGMRTMANPAVVPAGDASLSGAGLKPLYRLTEGISQNYLRKLTGEALALSAGRFQEPLPPALTETYQLCPPEEAFSLIHFPASWDDVRRARRRLIFEELFTFCLAGQRLRSQSARLPGAVLERADPEEFFRSLPFAPTGAQRQAVGECFRDLCSGVRMNRLLQGDVGSGKTMVAAACAWLACKSGKQAVIMAPTELLARQHHASFSRFAAPFGIPVELLCGSTPASERKRIRAMLDGGAPMILCGTHALIQNDVALPAAALIVVDEQHRFGVRQRAALGEKSLSAHLLAMSATPIPRTLTLILYGDLEVSRLDELPPGRQEILTYAVPEEKRQDLYGFLRRQAAEGGQIYIVCPLIDGDEDDPDEEKKAAATYAKSLAAALPGLRIGLMHGRLKAAEKEAVMTAFLNRELDILVSTTVIEVGVDVPNATVMVVENADFFGLSQLHQLRGRVGRGSRQSYCFLMHRTLSEPARQRLRTLCTQRDGFAIAEADLRLRGPGDFFGRRQHGLPDFAIADLASDLNVLEAARDSAQALLRDDPGLDSCPLLRERVDAVTQKTLAVSLN
jgi:RecG-like helicase